MIITVGALKKVLATLPDNVQLADLEIGNRNFRTFTNTKRLLLLEDTKTKEQFLTINNLGSHYSEFHQQQGLKIITHFDQDIIDKL